MPSLCYDKPGQKKTGKVQIFTEVCLCNIGTGICSSLEVEGEDTYPRIEKTCPYWRDDLLSGNE